jgi:hypothetical protein
MNNKTAGNLFPTSNPQSPKPFSAPVAPKPLSPSVLKPVAAIKPAAPKLPTPTPIATQTKPAALLTHESGTAHNMPAQKPYGAFLKPIVKNETETDSLNGILLIVAIVVGFAAFGIQAWTLLY